MPSQENSLSSSQDSPVANSQNCSMNSSDIYRSPQIRKETLRTVYKNTQALQNNVNNNTVEHLDKMIIEVDLISKEGTMDDKIRDQGEVLLDSEIMSLSSKVLKKCTFTLQENVNFYDATEFAQKIRNYVCRMPDIVEDTPDWSLLGNQVTKCFKKTAALNIILGTLRPIPKKEITRKKIVKEAQAPTKRPEKVITLEKVEDSLEQTIVEICRIIKQYHKKFKKPLDFFELVLHPTDFGKTIENILHVSFLIRDGMIKFLVDEDGIPQLQKTTKTEMEEIKSNKNRRNIQNVLSITMKQWKSLVEAYRIDKPLIDLIADNTDK